MTLKDENRTLLDMALSQQTLVERQMDALARAMEILDRHAQLVEWFVRGDGDEGGAGELVHCEGCERESGSCPGGGAVWEVPVGAPGGVMANPAAMPAAAPMGPGGIPRTSYVQKVDPDRFPNLAAQVNGLPDSEAHSLAFVPTWTAEKLINRFGKLVVKHRPDLRAGVADFADVAARINEFHEMGIAVYCVRGSDTLLMLVDQPAKAIMGLGYDPNLFTENGHLACDIALEVPVRAREG